MNKYLTRALESKIDKYLGTFPCLAILGPRQCGKSTLVRHYTKRLKEVIFLDLEKPGDLRKLNDSEAFFEENTFKTICLDEIQRLPGIYEVLRVEIDRRKQIKKAGKFILLGSASPKVIKATSETLAGRIAHLELGPFLLKELLGGKEKPLLKVNERSFWLKGGFPDSIIKTEEKSYMWREEYIKTFLERDLALFGLSVPPLAMRRLWSMIAHLNGQTVNYSNLGGSLGVSHTTAKHYLDVLVQCFMVRLLLPFHSNIKKRLSKSPKIYIRDTGLLHSILEIESQDDLFGHPIYGQSWEGFVIENILSSISPRWKAFHYRTETGHEIDLILQYKQVTLCIEIKASGSPDLSKGFFNALEVINPKESFIIAPVKEEYVYSKEKSIRVMGILSAIERIEKLTQ